MHIYIQYVKNCHVNLYAYLHYFRLTMEIPTQKPILLKRWRKTCSVDECCSWIIAYSRIHVPKLIQIFIMSLILFIATILDNTSDSNFLPLQKWLYYTIFSLRYAIFSEARQPKQHIFIFYVITIKQNKIKSQKQTFPEKLTTNMQWCFHF